MACLSNQSTLQQSPCNRIALCFPTTTEKKSSLQAAPEIRGSGESQEHANVSFIFLWLKPLSVKPPGNGECPPHLSSKPNLHIAEQTSEGDGGGGGDDDVDLIN